MEQKKPNLFQFSTDNLGNAIALNNDHVLITAQNRDSPSIWTGCFVLLCNAWVQGTSGSSGSVREEGICFLGTSMVHTDQQQNYGNNLAC